MTGGLGWVGDSDPYPPNTAGLSAEAAADSWAQVRGRPRGSARPAHQPPVGPAPLAAMGVCGVDRWCGAVRFTHAHQLAWPHHARHQQGSTIG